MGAVVSRDRLAAVLGMMGSAHDGECLAAARMAERMRRDAGLTWADLLCPAAPATASYAAPEPPDWRDMLDACQRRPGRLTGWERDFIATLATYTHTPSDRQLAVLERLYAKVTA